MAQPNIKDHFKVGQRVKLVRVKHPKYRGLEGTIIRIFKTKNEIKVQVGENDFYNAFPQNIDPVPVTEGVQPAL
ncbi:MAG: hypothetical protein KJ077_10945 [Anaerolineae bacterium]|nr:hypothetical protein [Anaerolineae bacterium]